MAIASVQTPFGGGSGWDPLSSFGESYMDYLFGSAAADDAQERAQQNALYNSRLAQELGLFQYGLNINALREAPAAARAGLIAAGYNPLLAVNSGAGASFSNSLPGAGGSGAMASLHGSNSQGGSVTVGSLLGKQMEKIEAETNFIRRRTDAEGWIVKTLTAHEARGFGASFARALGLNFNGSESQTFLVAYNTITGEFRNLTNTDSLGSTGETTDAASVRVIGDGDAPVKYYYDSSSDKPVRFEYDRGRRYNLPR